MWIKKRSWPAFLLTKTRIIESHSECIYVFILFFDLADTQLYKICSLISTKLEPKETNTKQGKIVNNNNFNLIYFYFRYFWKHRFLYKQVSQIAQLYTTNEYIFVEWLLLRSNLFQFFIYVTVQSHVAFKRLLWYQQFIRKVKP